MSLTNDGLDELYNKLQNILKDNKNKNSTNKILKEFGIISTSRIRENFNKTVDPYGITWAPLKAGGRYVKRGKKSYLDKTAKPLLDNGRLVSSISYRTFNSSDSSVLELYSEGSNVNYSQYHQLGIGVTARPFLPTSSRGLPQVWNNDLIKIVNKIIGNLLNS